TLSLVWKHPGGEVPHVPVPDARSLEELASWKNAYEEIGQLIERADLKRALEAVFERIRAANRYIDQAAPWRLLSVDPGAGRRVLGSCVQLAANAAQLAYPFVPFSAEAALGALGLQPASWQLLEIPPGTRLSGAPQPLIRRLDPSVAAQE